MFENTKDRIESSKPCRRDPEEMLEGLRNRKEEFEKAEQLLLELTNLPIHFEAREAERSVAVMLGELRIKLFQLERQEDRLLDEINGEVAK